MTKLLVGMILGFAALSAQADTLTYLAPPASPLANVQYARCAGESFTADGLTVNGACQYTLKCNVRGCHGASYTYATTWTLDGTATLGAKRAASPLFLTAQVVTLDGVTYYLQGVSVLGAILGGTGYSSVLWQP